MRLVTFLEDGRPQAGLLHGEDEVVRLADLLPCEDRLDVVGFLAAGPRAMQEVGQALARTRPEMLRLGALTLLPPVPSPSKIIGAARNYHDAIAELKMEVPIRPQLFAKLPNTILAPNAPIILGPASDQVTYEGELAVVIGRRGHEIPRSRAMDHVGGYTVLNDVSATDVTKRDGFLFGKNLDGFCPFGPLLGTADEIADPHNLRLTTMIDGRTVQDSNTGRMVFDISALVAAISQIMTLEVGDIIATGTPGGVASVHTPPLWLHDGMTVSVTVEGIGTLTNPVTGRPR